jgi:hypothetical protein
VRRRRPQAPAFEPAGAVTGIGSLPFVDPAEAVAFVARHCPEVPFLPEPPLRQLTDGALAQVLDGWGRSAAGEVALAEEDLPRFVGGLRSSPPDLAGWVGEAFARLDLALSRGDLPVARAVKVQLTGPITLSWLVKVDAEPASLRPSLVATLAERVCRQAAWAVRSLDGHGIPVLVVLDEPALGLVGGADECSWWPVHVLSQVCEVIREEGGLAGVHCCTSADPAVAAATGADLLSFDARGSLGRQPSLASHWRAGRSTAFGLVASNDDEGVAGERFGEWLGWCPPDDLASAARRTLVTATCGLGLLDAEQACRSFRTAQAVGDLVSAVASGATVDGSG